MNGPRSLPEQQCVDLSMHDGHVHVNGGPNGGCGLPEWCHGVSLDELPDPAGPLFHPEAPR